MCFLLSDLFSIAQFSLQPGSCMPAHGIEGHRMDRTSKCTHVGTVYQSESRSPSKVPPGSSLWKPRPDHYSLTGHIGAPTVIDTKTRLPKSRRGLAWMYALNVAFGAEADWQADSREAGCKSTRNSSPSPTAQASIVQNIIRR